MPVIKTADYIKDNKDLIFDLCEREGVKNFTVSFDGSGDSGQIEGINLDSKVLNLPVQGAKVNNGTQWSNGARTIMWKDANDLEELIESVCYDVLEDACDGWEINDGSYGEFFFDVEERKVRLDFNERIVESKHTGYRF
jgi:hypothetical protein